MNFPSNRTVGAAVMMSLLLVLAGCSGGFGPGDSTTTEMNETDVDETETTTANETTTGDGHDDSHDGETTNSTDENASAASGPMLVLLDGQDTHVANASASENASFWVDDSHTWHASNESFTLATALSQLGMEANESSLTYDGTTYRDSNNTTVAYRVNGQPVEDPESYEVESGDKVFVTTHTENASMPGRKYTANHPHPHGSLNVSVNGTTVDFTQSKYTHADDYFHFHGDEGAERWHAHSMNLTVDYAISAFPGLNLTNDTFTYENTTYENGENGTKINVTVNGETVDTSTYVLKDGDDVRVVVEENASE
ncbi:hypothetical protein [Halorussus salinisoli]|uniref:hypothetical protein n=1 Tax=Halorussus salinisoli TaxID=2558242 RepID=UPI0010C16EFF|nr:hypothetical protein [Halorussus salinisoli]